MIINYHLEYFVHFDSTLCFFVLMGHPLISLKVINSCTEVWQGVCRELGWQIDESIQEATHWKGVYLKAKLRMTQLSDQEAFETSSLIGHSARVYALYYKDGLLCTGMWSGLECSLIIFLFPNIPPGIKKVHLGLSEPMVRISMILWSRHSFPRATQPTVCNVVETSHIRTHARTFVFLF